MSNYGRRYTAQEKIAYYKAKALGREKYNGGYSRYGGHGRYSRSYGGRVTSYSGKGRYVSNGRKYSRYSRYSKYRGGYKNGVKSGGAPVVTTDQTTGIKSTLGSIGETVGGMIVPGVGGMIGRGLGNIVGDGINFFTGKGEYEVRENAFLKNMVEGNDMPPIINKTSGGGTTIRYCEYIGDIITSGVAGEFKIQSFPVNPGVSTTFQWLSQLAGNYEQWVCEGMYFEFRSMSSDSLNSVNTALGSVVMAADYNCANEPFKNKQQMENYEGGVSQKPSLSCRYFIECAGDQTVLDDMYTRTEDVPEDQDPRFYDLCHFQIATVGCQGTNVNIGELRICYQINLKKPKLHNALGLNIAFNQINTANVTSLLPLGDTWTFSGASTVDIGMTSTVMTLPFRTLPQAYLVVVHWRGTVGALNSMPSLTYGTGVDGILRDTSGFGTANTSACQAIITAYVEGNTLTPTITFGAGGTLPGSCSGFIYVTQVPNTYLE